LKNPGRFISREPVLKLNPTSTRPGINLLQDQQGNALGVGHQAGRSDGHVRSGVEEREAVPVLIKQKREPPTTSRFVVSDLEFHLLTFSIGVSEVGFLFLHKNLTACVKKGL
ncbi:hypothetical protein, partial [Pseudomonas sp.]|uniref:hypothetical protein n=1 Tax=Pseudomonas sp. TaxID=306 RepID=UPI002354960B